ncbi:4'-phosphopantetheinyl transferase family protein [Bradyrhizobium manausense]|nr:4'-phosphopantetheinyl transferase superfamily protein [Bradyrhizobium manausense]
MATYEAPEISDSLEHLGVWLSAVVPQDIAIAIDRISSSTAFDAAEQAVVARAVSLRRDEFVTGRRLAREALARLGSGAVSLPPDQNRVPQWPDGFVGTISHSGKLCAALVGHARNLAGLGIDIEQRTNINPDIEPLICRPDEAELDEEDGATDLMLLRFVAKEAFFKAYFPATRHFLDFLDVQVSIDRGSNSFVARLMKASSPSLSGSRTFVGRCAALEGCAVAVIWMTY